MKIVKWGLTLLLTPFVLFGLFVIFAQITNYSSKEQIVLAENPAVEILANTVTFSAVAWNIGSVGRDNSMDFFYEGGKNVRPTRKASLNNLEGILKTLINYQNFGFLLLEEVELKSKRSYFINR